MMTSAQIRQSFLDFFQSKHHTIVPSASLLPDSPNLLFTNAGMNQFVPIFLGERRADVSKWAGAVPGSDTRAADTQKCIRAGGKHNDLDDVGLDTYHHTFFEMLGNWSFGDYFKQEAIAWAWELVVGIWKFPPQRLYATVYNPDKAKGDPSEFDQEAWDHWARLFRGVGLDPAVHIVNGNKKDNFWMMGDTGPCGPCSELHVDLTPLGDTRGALVNQGSPKCIEIWNLVFIQYNANADGSFSPLPAKHVDTGMGFERVTSIIQGTKGFTDFANAKISNYETDIFRPIFDELEKLSGKKYGSTLPGDEAGPAGVVGQASTPAADGQAPRLSTAGEAPAGQPTGGGAGPTTREQVQLDIAFRVIADHIRTLGFAVADGIQPGNTDRNYVLRRILRRAVRYGRTLGFKEPFFYKLVDVLARTMGDVFPEIRAKQQHVKDVLKLEEETFNKTLDSGICIFEGYIEYKRLLGCFLAETKENMMTLELARKVWLSSEDDSSHAEIVGQARSLRQRAQKFKASLRYNVENEKQSAFLANVVSLGHFIEDSFIKTSDPKIEQAVIDRVHEWLDPIERDFGSVEGDLRIFGGRAAFELYDTYGFPLDLTELMARERGLTVDKEGFEKLMEAQRARARAAQKKTVIELSQIETKTPTAFLGYDHTEAGAEVQEVVQLKDKTVVVLNHSVCYAEMGGQVGDTGEIILEPVAADVSRRTSTDGADSRPRLRITNTQKSGPTWLHFIEGEDAPAPGQHVTVRVDVPRRAAIQRHHTVTHLLHWALHEVASREAAQKGSFVGPDKLTFDFNSAPLTPEQVADIERLVNERILENAGVSWTEVPYSDVKGRADVMQFFGDKYGDTVRVVQVGGRPAALDGYSMELCGGTHARATGEIGLFRIVGEAAVAAGVRRIEAVAGLPAYALARGQAELIRTLAGKAGAPVAELEKKLDALLAHQKELEKALKAAAQREAAGRAKELLARAETVHDTPALIANLGDANGDTLQAVADALKGQFQGVIVLGGHRDGAVSLVAAVTPEFTAKAQAGKLIQAIAPLVGGKGGGRPDNARGGGKDATKLDEALAKVKSLLV